MKYNMSCRIFGIFYHGACKKELRKKDFTSKVIRNIKLEYKKIALRAKDIGKNKMMSAYMMGAYFISLNRNTGLSPQENYEIFKDGLYASKLFHKALGNAETYLDEKKLTGRKKWSKESHKRIYENDWVVDILEGNEEYDLGYDYHECGVCKLCRDEGCPELAKYLCQLDFVLADMMGMKLVRTKTIAEGGDFCDFRYSRK
ncbi:MAG: L-2-amino-thiazoline-4-carboxylic acid hydrolase [Lachnospiraceae bacterium]|nr:L-2-amino-thiazoline-4-carboxylic acid hydrolase [Lachnospiraceae bacterium]